MTLVFIRVCVHVRAVLECKRAQPMYTCVQCFNANMRSLCMGVCSASMQICAAYVWVCAVLQCKYAQPMHTCVQCFNANICSLCILVCFNANMRSLYNIYIHIHIHIHACIHTYIYMCVCVQYFDSNMCSMLLVCMYMWYNYVYTHMVYFYMRACCVSNMLTYAMYLHTYVCSNPLMHMYVAILPYMRIWCTYICTYSVQKVCLDAFCTLQDVSNALLL
jgi:hypothetical protein